jgi:hypothetical protein
MNLSTYTQRLVKASPVVVAVAAMAVPLAHAEVWPGGRDGAQLSTQVSYPAAIDRAAANHKSHVLAPDDRSRVRPEASYLDAVARAVSNRKAALERTTQPSIVARQGKAFDWGAAGVGASGAAALLLALGGGIGMARRSRTRSARA